MQLLEALGRSLRDLVGIVVAQPSATFSIDDQAGDDEGDASNGRFRPVCDRIEFADEAEYAVALSGCEVERVTEHLLDPGAL